MRRRITMISLAVLLALTSVVSELLHTPQPVNAAGEPAPLLPAASHQASQQIAQGTNAAAEPADLALGLGHTCWVTQAQTVQCWGLNRYGQLGDGTTTDRLSLANVNGLTGVVAVTAGLEHTCAVLGNGTVQCWGYAAFGQLGNGEIFFRMAPTPVSGLVNAVAVTAGASHTCALIAGGTVQCWGYNSVGQLGDGTTTQRNTPVTVTGLANVVAVAAEGSHTCALLQDATIRCWGSNSSGELGDGSFANQLAPVPVVGLTNVAAIALGNRHTCALLADKTVRCWGYNYSGQIGDGTQSNRATPTPVVGISDATGIVAGGYFSCAQLSNATVSCWGNNTYSELGGASGPISTTPQPVQGLANAARLAGGNAHTCARLTGGDVMCWGWNGFGQLGDGTKTDQLSPEQISIPTNVQGVATGRQHACALLYDGRVMCWGLNANGQVGDGTSPYDRIEPTFVVGLSNATAVAAGYYHSCALLADGTVKCWGSNGNGQLGDGTRNQAAVPVAVSSLSGIVAISAGGYHTCALRSNGSMACWGNNQLGQIGNGTTTDQLTPVDVLSGVAAIAAGNLHTCALLTNGSADCWGYNSYGQLGDGTQVNRMSPVPVAGVANIAAIAPGVLHTCALLASGTVSCWGDNTWGELGDGTVANRLAPAPVGGLSNVRVLESGARHTCAVLQNGTAVCWGDNRYGQLGDSSTEVRRSPDLVTGLTSATAVAGSDEFTCFVSTPGVGTGTAACTGSNAYGQMGRGQPSSKSTPVLVFPNNRVSVVDDGGAPLAGAEVWIYRSGQRLNLQPATSDTLGRAPVPQLLAGDRVVALLPVPGGVHQGWPYRLYITSLDDGAAYVVAVDGEQPVLTVKKTSPLFLFDLVVSLEWCDGQQAAFDVPQQQFVRNGLAAASRYLYDVTDGQFAFGAISVYDCSERWQDADVQILASSYVRPWANTGGIVAQPLSYVSRANKTLKFAPGHIRMGRTWTRDGSVNTVRTDNKVWLDNPDAVRAFTHEFLHYAAFLFDQYVYTDADGALKSAICTDVKVRTDNTNDSYWTERRASAMYWPYNASELEQEEMPTWTPACKDTEQYQQHGESSWNTLVRMYSDSQNPPRWAITSPRDRLDKQPLPGPEQDQAFPDLPRLSPAAQRTDVSTELLKVRYADSSPAADQQVQVFLVRQASDASRSTQIIDQGSPDTGAYLLAPGYKKGDVAVAVSWDGKYYGISPNLGDSNWVLTLGTTAAGRTVWSPRLSAQPVAAGGTMTGLDVKVCGADVGPNVYTMIVPVGGKSTAGLRLNSDGAGCYGGRFEMGGTPIPEAHLWVCQQDSARTGCDPLRDRFTVVTYALGDGSPGSHGRSYVPSTSNGYCTVHLDDGALTADAPVLFMAVRSAAMQPPAGHKYVGTPCYVGLPAGVAFAKPSPMLLYYNETELLGGSADSLQVWRWDDAALRWQTVSTSSAPDRYTYFTSLQITQPGTYVVTTQLPIQNRLVATGPDSTGSGTVEVVNAVRLSQEGTVEEIFPAACQLKALFAFDPNVTGGILRYIPGAPSYVNNLQQIEAGQTYYAQVGADCVTGQAGVNTAGATGEPPLAQTIPANLLPATYYGTVRTPSGMPAAPGAAIAGQVDGRTWGQTRTFSSGTATVYVLSVAGDDPLIPELQGAQPGSQVRFLVDGVEAQTPASIAWQPASAANVDLTASVFTFKNYLPAVQR